MPNLLENVTKPLEMCLGLTLREAWYHCLRGETDGSDFEDSDFYFGGEVRLEFDPGNSLYISWFEHSGRDHHFSLAVSDATVFKPDALEPWPVSHLRPWSPVLGKRLVSSSIYGRASEIPYVVRLSFEADVSVYVGSGYQREFGDGDDILVRSQETMFDVEKWDMLWNGTEAPGRVDEESIGR